MSERAAPTVEIEHLHILGRGVSRAKVAGTIDERFQRDCFAALSRRHAPVILDLDGATRITSFGVREWMGALKDLPAESYYFVNVRPALFTQFNIVNGFGGKGHVVSFYCPYLCPACDTAFDVLVDLRQQRDLVVKKKAPKCPCPSCKTPSELDDSEAAYFARAATWPPLALSADVDAAISGGAPRGLTLEKTIDGDLTVLWLAGALDKTARLRRHLDGLEGTVLIVLGAVQSASPESASELAALLSKVDADVYLARVHVDVFRVLSRAPGLLDRVKVLSVLSTTQCKSCGEPCEHDLVRCAHGTAETNVACVKCGAHAIPAPSDADVAAVRKLGFFEAPPETAIYLGSDARPKPFGDTPVHDGSGDEPPRAHKSRNVVGMRIGKYEVIRRLGMGGMAEVLLGKQLGIHGFEKQVVIKRILPNLVVLDRFVQMFVHEARIAARLLHPNVVQVYDLIEEGGEYYTIMEYVPGSDFNQILRNAARLGVQIPIELCCRVVADVCGALEAAHGYRHGVELSPIIHRDVSPHNVLISTEGTVKLADFGVAKAADSLNHTKTGALKGKVAYMAPEQLLGEPSDHRIDVYAAGYVLYAALTQHHPFYRQNELASMKAVLDAAVPPVHTLRDDIPPALSDIVMRAVQRDRAARFATAAELRDALEDFLAGYGRPSGASQLSAWLRDFLARVEAAAELAKTPEGGKASWELDRTLATGGGHDEPVDVTQFDD